MPLRAHLWGQQPGAEAAGFPWVTRRLAAICRGNCQRLAPASASLQICSDKPSAGLTQPGSGRVTDLRGGHRATPPSPAASSPCSHSAMDSAPILPAKKRVREFGQRSARPELLLEIPQPLLDERLADHRGWSAHVCFQFACRITPPPVVRQNFRCQKPHLGDGVVRAPQCSSASLRLPPLVSSSQPRRSARWENWSRLSGPGTRLSRLPRTVPAGLA